MTGSKWNLAHQVESTNTGEIDYYFQQAERRAQQLADLREVTASFARRYIKFSPLREKDLSQRSRTKFMWNISLEYQKFVSNSQFAFIQEAYPLTTSDKLKHLHEQVLIDYEESDKLARKWADSETELSNFEYTIQQREKVLASLVDRMLFLQTEITLPGRGASTATDEVDSQSPSTTASFAEAGEVNLLRDRLAELQMEYDDAHATREIQEEQERTMDISNADFEAIFLHQQTQLIEALTEAIRVADDAKRVCLNEGMDPENFKTRQAAESTQYYGDVDQASHMLGSPSSGHANVAPTVEITAPATSLSLGKQPFPQTEGILSPAEDRVAAWMDDLAEVGPQIDAQLKRPLSMSSISSPTQSILGRAGTREYAARKRDRNGMTAQQSSSSEERTRLKSSSSDSQLDERRKEREAIPDFAENVRNMGPKEQRNSEVKELYG